MAHRHLPAGRHVQDAGHGEGRLGLSLGPSRTADFATSVRVVVDDGAKITSQKMVSPRLPIVQTRLEAGSLSILEEAFAAEKQTPKSPDIQNRGRSRGMPWERTSMQRDWAKPQAGVTRQLATIAGGTPQPIHYQIKVQPGSSAAVAVGLCEGWHDQADQRVLDITVEGTPTRTIDTVADLGKNVAGIFWFDAKDVNRDGIIDLTVKAAKNAKDKNAILNGFWVFEPSMRPDSDAVLSGSLDSQALSVNYAGQPDFESRKDYILVRVTNNGDSARTVEPKVIVESALRLDTVDDGQIQVDSHEKVLCTEKVASLKKRKTDRGEEAVMTLSPIWMEPAHDGLLRGGVLRRRASR